MTLIETSAPQPSAAQLAAQSIIDSINAEIAHRVRVHQTAWETLWRNEREGATPEAILGHLGTHAALIFAFSRENLQHIADCCALVGKRPADFLPAQYWSTPHSITLHDNGTATL